MNIPDGEYDIDLSHFGNDADSDITKHSIAIRYGFIPDSMDQASPLTLFQRDEMCILEASSVERLKQNGPPIIFEGVPQRQRPVQSGALQHSSLPQDSYFLSFSPAEKGPKKLKVQLRRLDSTVRVNKSRNADKWRTSIKGWRSGLDEIKPIDIPSVSARMPKVQSPFMKRKPVKLSTTSRSVISKKGPPGKKSVSARETFSAKKTEPVRETFSAKKTYSAHKTYSAKKSVPAQKTYSAQKTVPASKRPPIAKDEPKDAIISVSDFEDLSSDSEDSFPVFNTMASQINAKEKASNESVPKTTDAKVAPSGRVGSVAGKGVLKAQKAIDTQQKSVNDTEKDLDMDDEFADLEDQLDEVLDNGQMVSSNSNNPAAAMSDSDEDSDTGFFSGTTIKIDNGDDTNSKKNIRLQNAPSKSKPMSLRDLYGGDKNDYLSSSEEE